MTTGIESWNIDLMSIGPMYPFVGGETLLTAIGVATWLVWHFMQARGENQEVNAEEATYSDPERLAQAMEAERH
jgi:hypothetical protein